MAETLKYDFEAFERNPRLTLDVPQNVIYKALNHSRLAAVLGKSASTRVLNTEAIDGGTRLLFNTKRVGNADDSFVRAAELTSALTVVEHFTPLEQRDPNLHVVMGLEPINATGRYGMIARIAWPEKSDRQLEQIATSRMQEIALSLRYMPKRDLKDTVGAVVDREHYVTLETNPVGSCSIGTDSYGYDPKEPVFEVVSHNIYSPVQQLICLAGAIAIARADES